MDKTVYKSNANDKFDEMFEKRKEHYTNLGLKEFEAEK